MADDLCRICMESGRFLFSLFGTKTTANFVEIITQITGIAVKSDDQLPKSICSCCFKDVEISKNLIERCKKSDEMLRKRFLLGEGLVNSQGNNESKTIQLIEVFEAESHSLTLKTSSTESAMLNIDDIIEESFGPDSTEVDIEDVGNNEIVPVSDVESSVLDELIITDPTAQVAGDQEPNYTQCCGCIQHFSCYEELQEHSRNMHLDDKAICGPVPDNLIECSICYKMFSGVSYLDAMHRLNAFKNRIVSVGFPDVRQCCTCDFKATSADDMQQHSEQHVGERISTDHTKPFECQFCFKRYKDKQTLNFHQKFSFSHKKLLVKKRRGSRAVKKRTEIESLSDSRKCCGCSAEFHSLDSLKQHSRMHHELYRSRSDSSNSFACEICFKHFPTLIRLEQHRLVPYMRNHKCDNCGKTFLTLNLLQKHMQYHERKEKVPLEREKDCNEKTVQCDTCGKTFKNKFYLKSHQKSKHSEEKPFSCSLCSKVFKWKHTLQNHLRVHTKEQPYACEFCPKTFTQLTDKKRHESSHSLEYPLRCSICDKGFSSGRRQQLERHEKLHELGEEYPFTCQFCDRTFTRLNQRNRHQARHVAERERSIKKKSMEIDNA